MLPTYLVSVKDRMSKLETELKTLRVQLELLNVRLESLEEVLGLFYEEKYGVKPKLSLWDLEKEPKQRKGF